MEKERKHLLDTLKEDFKAKIIELKRNFEEEYANSSKEVMDELSDIFKAQKKKVKELYKAEKKEVKSASYTRMREIQENDVDHLPTDVASSGSLVKEAKQHLGTPYKYGGSSKQGFDCSGFVKYVYGRQGIDLPQVSGDQANSGMKVSLANSRPGDLLFFSHGGNKIDHVGIVLKNEGETLEMIHASSSKGVIKTEVNSSVYWKRRLKKARRVN
ncbi:MAG: C40 family peptidase [Flavobacteriales bacterium]|nr:C40 family peptidase [Flavobacteriales bacterium]